MTTFDSSGIEVFITENNPKYANKIIKKLMAFAKAPGFDRSYDSYKAAYVSMPHASANPEIKQLYISGHFCCVFKFGIVTTGLGISSVISLSITSTLYCPIPTLLLKRDRIPLTKINPSMIQSF